MPKYRIATEDKAVDVCLFADEDGDITLCVGDWTVASLTPKGTLILYGCIDAGSDEGIQVDEDGRIKLEKS